MIGGGGGACNGSYIAFEITSYVDFEAEAEVWVKELHLITFLISKKIWASEILSFAIPYQSF